MPGDDGTIVVDEQGREARSRSLLALYATMRVSYRRRYVLRNIRWKMDKRRLTEETLLLSIQIDGSEDALNYSRKGPTPGPTRLEEMGPCFGVKTPTTTATSNRSCQPNAHASSERCYLPERVAQIDYDYCWKCWKHSLLALHQSGKLGHVTQL